MSKKNRRLIYLFTFLLAVAIFARTSQAAEIEVETRSDVIAVDGRCSLREAIDAANADLAGNDCSAGSGHDVILLDFSSTIVMELAGANEDGNQIGDFDITDDLTIRNVDSSNVVTIDGAGLDRIFHVLNGADLTLEGLRLEGGITNTFGGAILVLEASSFLELSGSIVADNQASLLGGGIYSEAPVMLEGCQVTGNTAGSGGGVFMGTNSELTLIDSRVSANRALSDGGGLNLFVLNSHNSGIHNNDADRFGGGVFWRGGGSASDVSHVVNTTVGENSSLQDGGGLHFVSAGILELLNSTVAWNVADLDENNTGDGGGIFVLSGQVRLRNTIVAANEDRSPNVLEAVAPDCSGSLSSLGYNLLAAVDTAACAITGTLVGNLTGTVASPLDAEISCVVSEPGEPGVVLPSPTSAAVDAGDPGGCLGASGTPLVDDQLGNLRPWDGGDPGPAPRCDIGAVEQGAPGVDFIFGDGLESGNADRWSSAAGALFSQLPMPAARLLTFGDGGGSCLNPE